jgi:hypothetical protein
MPENHVRGLVSLINCALDSKKIVERSGRNILCAPRPVTNKLEHVGKAKTQTGRNWDVALYCRDQSHAAHRRQAEIDFQVIIHANNRRKLPRANSPAFDKLAIAMNY